VQQILVRTRHGAVGEHPPGQRTHVLAVVVLPHEGQVQRAGQGRRRGEPLGLPQRPAHRAVTAHRQARDEGVRPPGGDPEKPGDGTRQLLGQELPEPHSVRLVGVEAAVYLGHHDGQPAGGGVPLDRGVPGPRGVVVGQPVQQVEHRRRGGVPAALDADLGRRRLRQQHRHRGAQLQRLGEEVTADQGHRASLDHPRRPRRPGAPARSTGSAGESRHVILAHLTSETARHAGQADILREQLDGTTGR
jgi:hypothetical protein